MLMWTFLASGIVDTDLALGTGTQRYYKTLQGLRTRKRAEAKFE